MTARYDRLAPLEAPGRERAFPGWAVLRDLDGIERDGDAARRARLRFLALRPAYRLVVLGFGGVPVESFDRQIDRVREELGQLPARDQERSALAALLNDLRSREPVQVITAILAASEFAEANGQLAAAEEYARVALELTRAGDDRLAVTATRALARIALAAGQLELAAAHAHQACDLALSCDDRGEWIRSIGQLASTYRGTGDPNLARDALLQALNRAREWGNNALIGLAFGQLCRYSADNGQPEVVIEYGWFALPLLERNEDRAQVLTLMGAALNALGFNRAAERCYAWVTPRQRETFDLLGQHSPSAIRVRAEEVMRALEQSVSTPLIRRPADTVLDQTRRIAAELEHMADSLVVTE